MSQLSNAESLPDFYIRFDYPLADVAKMYDLPLEVVARIVSGMFKDAHTAPSQLITSETGLQYFAMDEYSCHPQAWVVLETLGLIHVHRG